MFDFEKIGVSKLYSTKGVERVVEFCPQDVDVDNVARVLSLSVNAKCVNISSFDGYAQVDGRANFKLVYLDKDGNPHGVDYNADFGVRVDGDYLEGDNLQGDVHVVETDCEVQDNITLSAVLMVEASGVRQEELEVLVDADDCYISHKSVFIPTLLAHKSVVVSFDDEETVGGDVSSVLSLSPSVIVKNVSVEDGVCKVQSRVLGRVTYYEGGDIKERVFDIPIEDEFSIEDLTCNDNVKVSACIKNAKIILQGVTDDNVIRLEGEVQYRLWAFALEQKEIVGDMFMLTNETEVETSNVAFTCFDGCGFFNERVSGTATLSDTKAPVVDVLAIPNVSCYTTKTRRVDDNTLDVEGVVNADIIYQDENGFNSIRAEIPFTLSLDSQTVLSKEVKVDCSVQSIGAVVKQDREFEINMLLSIEVCGYSALQFDYISSVTVGQERAQNTSGLSIFIASEGDDMLTVCKTLTAMPGDISLQNPDVTFPLHEGERIIYFRHID